MKLDDITVLVRDKDYQTQGMIAHEDLDLEASVEHNNVGSWKLQIAADHPLATLLRSPGAGLIVQGPNDIIFSGPTVKPELAITPDDPGGTITIEGVTDNVALADALAFPDPAHNLNEEGQLKANDVRTGKSETLMHAYVNANIGPGATALRRKDALLMGPDLARGSTITKAPRFQGLGELLSEIAIEPEYPLGFRIVQRGDNIQFETYQVQDKRAEIRLDARNRTLAGQRVAFSPPGLTAAIVAGQGQGTDRQLFEVTSTESVAAGAEWGRRIERFIDQRNTNDVNELQKAGQEPIDEEGFTAVNVQAVPAEDSFMTFGVDWYLGDRITVVVEDQEMAANVTGFVFKIDSSGFKVGAVIGDPTGFSKDAALSKRITNTESRIGAIERSVELSTKNPWTKRSIAQLTTADSNSIPNSSVVGIRFIRDLGHTTYLSPPGATYHDIGHEWETLGDEGWFYLPLPGLYEIKCNLTWASDATPSGVRYLRLVSALHGNIGHHGIEVTGIGWVTSALSIEHYVSPDDYNIGEKLRFTVQQTSGAALPFADGSSDMYSNVSIRLVEPALPSA